MQVKETVCDQDPTYKTFCYPSYHFWHCRFEAGGACCSNSDTQRPKDKCRTRYKKAKLPPESDSLLDVAQPHIGHICPQLVRVLYSVGRGGGAGTMGKCVRANKKLRDCWQMGNREAGRQPAHSIGGRYAGSQTLPKQASKKATLDALVRANDGQAVAVDRC